MKCYQPKKLFKVTLAIFKISVVVMLSPLVFYLQFYLPIAMGGVLLSAILFLTIGGFERIYVHPFEDSKEYKDCLFGQMYNLEERLEKEKKRREELYRELRESWKNVMLGIGLYLLGFCIVLASVLLAQILVVFILGVVPGLYIEVMCFDWIWIGYINSSAPFAKKISEEMAIHSASVKAEESSKMIAVLTRRVREKEEREWEERQKAWELLQEKEQREGDVQLKEQQEGEALQLLQGEAQEKQDGLQTQVEGNRRDVKPGQEYLGKQAGSDNQEGIAKQEGLLNLSDLQGQEVWTQEKLWAQEEKQRLTPPKRENRDWVFPPEKPSQKH